MRGAVLGIAMRNISAALSLLILIDCPAGEGISRQINDILLRDF
jgi:hypothetical protein